MYTLNSVHSVTDANSRIKFNITDKHNLHTDTIQQLTDYTQPAKYAHWDNKQ